MGIIGSMGIRGRGYEKGAEGRKRWEKGVGRKVRDGVNNGYDGGELMGRKGCFWGGNGCFFGGKGCFFWREG